GSPDRLSTDIGPVVDRSAQQGLVSYIETMRARAYPVFQPALDAQATQAFARGNFVPPTLIELNGISELGPEVFGPVLHVVRYRRGDLGRLVESINGTGYGLTLGIHTRIDETVEFVTVRAKV